MVHDDALLLADRYDAVVRKIARENRVRRRTAQRWFVELVRFLDLCENSPSIMSPPKKVDKAWHQFLLFTRDYSSFCQQRYGRFLHHDPFDEPDEDAYRHTYQAYKKRYGRLPDHRVWATPASKGGWSTSTSGGCGGGGCGGGGA